MTIQKIFIRTPYNYDTNKASDEAGLECPEPTLTQQQFAEEVDINTIVNRFLKTGEVPGDLRTPEYSDFDGIFDFHTAMNAVTEARENFMKMPAQVRSRFGNDPQSFYEFCTEYNDDLGDLANRAEMEKLGLAIPRPKTLEQAAGATPSPAAPDPKGDTKGVT